MDVEIRGAEGQSLTLTVVDMQGRAVYNRQVRQAGESEIQTVQLGRPAGTYLLRVSSPTQKPDATQFTGGMKCRFSETMNDCFRGYMTYI